MRCDALDRRRRCTRCGDTTLTLSEGRGGVGDACMPAITSTRRRCCDGCRGGGCGLFVSACATRTTDDGRRTGMVGWSGSDCWGLEYWSRCGVCKAVVVLWLWTRRGLGTTVKRLVESEPLFGSRPPRSLCRDPPLFLFIFFFGFRDAGQDGVYCRCGFQALDL